MGVSPSRLLGREPAQITTIERDTAGRITSIVTMREPEFTSDDLMRILASRRDSAAPRGAHGHLLSEATDPATQGRWKATPTTDFIQQALNRAQKKFREEHGDVVDTDALLWGAELED